VDDEVRAWSIERAKILNQENMSWLLLEKKTHQDSGVAGGISELTRARVGKAEAHLFGKATSATYKCFAIGIAQVSQSMAAASSTVRSAHTCVFCG
jgi:hypothetical protein